MGLKPKEVRALTTKDFNFMLVGFMRRREEKWDIARHTWAHAINFANGAKQYLNPEQLRKLPMTDKTSMQVKPITSFIEAMELLKDFKNG